MSEAADQYSNEDTDDALLSRLTRSVEDWMDWFKPNNTRYRQAQEFLFESNINRTESATLTELQRPEIQANIVNAFYTHFIGEFAKNTPCPMVQPAAGDQKLAPQVEVVENHMRYMFDSTKNKQVDIFSNMLSGGFAIGKVKTKYINDESFDQVLEFDVVRDNTLAGFDPLARERHKGDGKYCFELYPKPKEEVEEEYGITIKDSAFSAMPSEGFSWFYTQGYGKTKQKVVMVCNLYEKKYKYKMLYLISDPTHPDQQKTITREEYKQLIAEIEEMGLMIEPPRILKKGKRKQTIIHNYQFIASQILEDEEMDYSFLPNVFFDGNSVWLKNNIQLCIPYIWYAMDMQRVKNTCLQHIMNEVENMRMTDVLIPKEALPAEEEYQEAWLNPQKTNGALVYNQFPQGNNNNGQPLNAPQVIPRGQVSQTVIGMFDIADKTIQAILGSYDAQQGQQNDMSGKAIEAGATQSNGSARPYIVNYITCMNQVLMILVDLMPKYYTTARTIPVMDKDGQRDFIRVNDSIQNPQYKLEYKINDLQVETQMNATFEVQRSKFLDMFTNLMKVNPKINAFAASEEGIMLVLDNLEVKDISLFKEKFQSWSKKEEQKQAKQQQIAMQMNPEATKLKIAQMDMQAEQAKQQAEIQNKEKDRRAELLKTAIDMHMNTQKVEAMNTDSQTKIMVAENQVAIAQQRAEAENQRSTLDAMIALDKHAYEKIESNREHALERSKHAADIVKTIGEFQHAKEENAIKREGNQRKNEGQSQEG